MTLTQFLAELEVVRDLERRAASNPGMERSHDHDESSEYRAYLGRVRALTDRLERTDASVWVEIRDWCKGHDEHLGDAVQSGMHMTEMDWNPKALCISEKLLLGMARRSPNVDREIEFWKGPLLASLLADPRWLDFPDTYARVLFDLRGLYPELIHAVHPEPLKTRLRQARLDPESLEKKLKEVGFS